MPIHMYDVLLPFQNVPLYRHHGLGVKVLGLLFIQSLTRIGDIVVVVNLVTG